MSHRIIRSLVATLAVAPLVAACGGGGDKKSSTSSSSGTPLAALPTVAAPTGPVSLDTTVSLKPRGSSSAGGGLLSSPITLHEKGVVAGSSGAADVTLQIKLGAASVDAALRSDGSKQWLQLGGQWYDLGGASSGGSSSGGSVGSAINPATLQNGIAGLGGYTTNVRDLGTESIDGGQARHVTADLDLAKVRAALGTAAGSLGSSGTASLFPAQAIVNGIDAGHVELWIGTSDNALRRAKLSLSSDTSKAQDAQGLQGLDLDVEATTTPTSAPTISAPAGARPASELQTALLTSLGPLLGGSG
jgi:hypothetical protein